MERKELTKEFVTHLVTKIVNAIGYDLPESCYKKALDYELRNYLFTVEQEVNIDVVYGLIQVGSVRADLIINRESIIELKATDKIKPKHRGQLEKYLRLLEYKKGFLINVSFNSFEVEEIENSKSVKA